MSVVRKRIPMRNALDKATGKAKFTVDLKLPGMLYAKMIKSPYAHARIIKIDKTRAEKMSGVVGVLTFKDVPRIQFGAVPPPFPQDRYILNERVRCVGEPVAAVAAKSIDIAEEALELINVEYEELSAVFDAEQAMKSSAPRIHPVKRNIVIPPINVEFGSVEKGFKKADYIFEDTYKTSIHCHCCAEPKTSIASWDAAGKLTVWKGTPHVFGVQNYLARSLGIPEGKVRVVLPTGGFGGGFGGKIGVQDQIAALLAKKTGRPVKLEFTREEEFVCTNTRHSGIIKIKTGVRKNGTLTARHSKTIYDAGAYATLGPDILMKALRSIALYRCPNIRFDGFLVYTNKPVAGAFRGYGNPQHTYAVELQNEKIAEKLGIDPMEWRLKNHIRVGDKNLSSGGWAHGKVGGNNWKSAKYEIVSCGLDKCIVEGAKRIGWREKRRRLGESGKIKKRGVGMACVLHGCGEMPAPTSASAFVRINEDGTVNITTGAVDHGGTGLYTSLVQICAQELGVHPENITKVIAGDTDITPFDTGSFASSRTYVAGGAVKAATADLKQQIFERAAKILAVRIDDLDIEDGRVYVKGTPRKGVSISEIVKRARLESPNTVIQGKSLYYEPPTDAPSFGAQFAEVEVNTETGQVKVLRMVGVYDIGLAINPMICEGQLEGAILQGMGYALTEGLLLDLKGRPLNPRFLDYKVLTALDTPEIETIIVESIEPTGPFGAKGAGECGIVPIAPAIANALHDAIGVCIKELPMTSEKILKGIGIREKEKKN